MCNCIAEANKELHQQNTSLATALTFDNKGNVRTVLPIPTKKIDSRKRTPTIRLMANHCPMCGERWQAEDDVVTAGGA